MDALVPLLGGAAALLFAPKLVKQDGTAEEVAKRMRVLRIAGAVLIGAAVLRLVTG